TRLIHQQYLWFHCDSTSDAQTLLLTTGKPTARLIQTVFDLIPQVSSAQRLFGYFLKLLFIFDAGKLEPSHDVVLNRHGGKRVSLLEYHADGVAHRYRINLWAIDIFAVEQNFTLDVCAWDDLVHTVDASQDRGLSATRRADERGYCLSRDVHVDVLHSVEITIEDIHIIEFEL